LEHSDGFHGDARRHVLRGHHDHGAAERDKLSQRHAYVARARRQVHEQVVQLAPQHVAQKLINDLGEHGAAPHDGLAGFDQKAHADAVNAVTAGRDDSGRLTPVGQTNPHLLQLMIVQTEQHRHGRAIHVGVHQADTGAALGQSGGQVHGNR
jgi:DNA-directed RNA polymerase specialized sigma54-like protein